MQDSSAVEQLQQQIEARAQTIGCTYVKRRGEFGTSWLAIVPDHPLALDRVHNHQVCDGVMVAIPTEKLGKRARHSIHYRQLQALAVKLDKHKAQLQQRAAALSTTTDRGAYLDALSK